ncbi:hypothetical protein Hanom_Chr05g00468301 [Helianthus anomalus]
MFIPGVSLASVLCCSDRKLKFFSLEIIAIHRWVRGYRLVVCRSFFLDLFVSFDVLFGLYFMTLFMFDVNLTLGRWEFYCSRFFFFFIFFNFLISIL